MKVKVFFNNNNIMLNRDWFENNKSFISFEDYQQGRNRYIKECIKKQRKEDREKLKQNIKNLFNSFLKITKIKP